MVRVTLGGDIEGFTSLGFDDHVKLFFPTGSLGEDGQPEFMARDYTPRRHDPQAGTLAIEFVIHDAGPATRWAEQAQPGQMLQIGGPRGSFVIPTEFDWHLLIGDDTGLPAIARRLEELPAGARAVALIEVDGPADQVAIASAADVTVKWVHRDGAEAGTPDLLAAGAAAPGIAARATTTRGRPASRSPPRRCVRSSLPIMAPTRNGSAPPATGAAAPSPSTTSSTIDVAADLPSALPT